MAEFQYLADKAICCLSRYENPFN